MNILFIIPSYKPAYVYGGPVYAVSMLAETLVRIGHQVTVFTTTANGDTDLDVPTNVPVVLDGVTVFYFNRWTRGHSHFSPALLRRFTTSLSAFDIIHIHSWWNLVAVSAAMLCFLKGRIPVISPRGSLTTYTLRHKNAFLKRVIHAGVGRRLLASATLMFTSAHEMREASKLVILKRCLVLPNILVLPSPATRDNPAGSGLRLLFLGRIDPAKNLELLIDTLAPGFNVDYECVIAGGGRQDYLRSLKARSRLNPRITWVGPVFGEEKFRLLANADILVLPSHTENYGNVVIEALSQGTPVLLSGQVGIADWVTANRLGWVADPEAARWRDAIMQILAEPAERERIRREGPQCVSRDFSPDELAREYIHKYEEHNAIT